MVDPRRRQNRPRDTAAGGQDRPQQAKSAKPESDRQAGGEPIAESPAPPPDLWGACDGPARVRPLRFDAHRVVESQSVTSTRKLVDSDDEQEVLEALIDRVKPPPPAGERFVGLHFLLSTPFRHPPLRNGSRFGGRNERGMFYGSRRLRTAFAEVAYYRFVFLAGTDARLTPLFVELSAFSVPVATERGIHLDVAPFDAYRARISSPTEYACPQALGGAMRSAGVEAFLFRSARDPRGGLNAGLFEPCFERAAPRTPEGWACAVSRDRVELRKKDVFRTVRLAFDRGAFEVGGQLPAPAA